MYSVIQEHRGKRAEHRQLDRSISYATLILHSTDDWPRGTKIRRAWISDSESRKVWEGDFFVSSQVFTVRSHQDD